MAEGALKMFFLDCLGRGLLLGSLGGAAFGALVGIFTMGLSFVLGWLIWGLHGALLGLCAGFAMGLITGLAAWLINSLSGRPGEVFGWYVAGVTGGLTPMAFRLLLGQPLGVADADWIFQLPPLIGGALCAWAAHRWKLPNDRVRTPGSEETGACR